MHFRAGLQLRKEKFFHGKRVKKVTLQGWIINYSKNVREKYDLPQGTPRRSGRGEQLELPHAEPGAVSSLIPKRLTWFNTKVGLLSLFLSLTSGFRSLFQSKPIAVLSNVCLVDKRINFGIKHLDSTSSSATYCVILAKWMYPSLSLNFLTCPTGIHIYMPQDF